MYARTYHRYAHLDAFDYDLAPDLADFDRLLACHRAMRQAEQSFERILASLAQEDDGGRRDEAVASPPRGLVLPFIPLPSLGSWATKSPALGRAKGPAEV